MASSHLPRGEERGIQCEGSVAYSARGAWHTVRGERGIQCERSVAYSARGAWHTVREERGIQCERSVAYSACHAPLVLYVNAF